MGLDHFVLYFFVHCMVLVYGQGIHKMSTNKPILRYGFQQTKECHDFERAYLCVRKCLDLKYDVGHSDKNCACTCYQKQDKAKYTSVVFGNSTKRKLGAPSTSLPAWAKLKHDTSEKGILEMSHEMGGISDEHDAPGDTSNSTLVELEKPTEVAVEDKAIDNNTAIDGATIADAAGDVPGAVSSDDTAANAATTVAAAE